MPAPSARPERPPSTTLAALVAGLDADAAPRVEGDAGTVVTGVTLSTARVAPGDLYVALAGARAHGADYAAAAERAGAVALLSDADGVERARAAGVDLPAVVVEEPRRVLGRLSAQAYGKPAERMRMLGVTGTQGKTTTTRMLAEALGEAGVPGAVIGTVGTRVLGEDVATTLTTPEAPDLHGLFAMMVERGVEACAMEVSSHALAMGRVDGVVFDVATFLNLGRDHLDFHADLEEYFAVKASLFTPARARVGLANLDDEHGRRLFATAPIPMHGYSLRETSATWHAADVELGPLGSRFTACGPTGERIAVEVPLPGEFNVSNALAAIGSAALAGLDAAAVGAALGRTSGVPGRLERVGGDLGRPYALVVDYAHKPDAVRAVLETLRPITAGRLVVVIGAGGDRDPGKRPIMGRIAGELADVVVVTDDNPRTEDPAAIRAEVLAGAREGAAEVVEEGDRRAAIRRAVRLAGPGDVVLVAGKGHESGQEVHGVVHPFDDRVVAAEEMARS